MKKTVLFLLVFISFVAFSFAQKGGTMKFKKLDKFKLDKEQLKAMTKANLSIYKIKKGYAFPGNGQLFYAAKTGKGGQFIIVLSSSKKNPEYLELRLNELPFEMRMYGDIIEYCSCGSNISISDGDSCQQYAVSGGSASVQCGGGCTGENLGLGCSYTLIDTRTGKTPID